MEIALASFASPDAFGVGGAKTRGWASATPMNDLVADVLADTGLEPECTVDSSSSCNDWITAAGAGSKPEGSSSSSKRKLFVSPIRLGSVQEDVNRVLTKIRDFARPLVLLGSASSEGDDSLLVQGFHRTMMQAGAVADSANRGVRMTPNLLVGMLVSLALGLVALLGTYCIMTIQSPTRYNFHALPRGKEF